MNYRPNSQLNLLSGLSPSKKRRGTKQIHKFSVRMWFHDNKPIANSILISIFSNRLAVPNLWYRNRLNSSLPARTQNNSKLSINCRFPDNSHYWINIRMTKKKTHLIQIVTPSQDGEKIFCKDLKQPNQTLSYSI